MDPAGVKENELADCILPRPDAVRECAIHNGDVRLLFSFLPGKRAAPLQRRAHGIKIAVGNRLVIDGLEPALLSILSFCAKAGHGDVLHRQSTRDGRGGHMRKAPQTVQQLIAERRLLRLILILRRRQRDPCGENLLRPEAEIDGSECA